VEASSLPAPASLARVSISAPLLRLRSDEQLVALFRAGSEEAFRMIHDRYRQRLFAYARQMLSGSRQDAEDALQDVFLRAYHALRSDERPISLRAWLYRVAHNRCIDHIRRPVPGPADIFDVSRRPVLDPIDATEQREDLRRLVADVRRLPEQQRSALLMRELQGMSYDELAAALNVTVAAVKSLLVRARMGLADAAVARDTACLTIREDLSLSCDRGVRASGLARRHLRDCAGCRDYRDGLRSRQRALAALVPAGPFGSLGLVAKAIGFGGPSAAAGGAATSAGGGAAALTAAKVAAVMCCAAAVTGGALNLASHAPAHRHHSATAARRMTTASTPPAAGGAASVTSPVSATESPASAGASTSASVAAQRSSSASASTAPGALSQPRSLLGQSSRTDAVRPHRTADVSNTPSTTTTPVVTTTASTPTNPISSVLAWLTALLEGKSAPATTTGSTSTTGPGATTGSSETTGYSSTGTSGSDSTDSGTNTTGTGANGTSAGSDSTKTGASGDSQSTKSGSSDSSQATKSSSGTSSLPTKSTSGESSTSGSTSTATGVASSTSAY
jgi:RNA polymerase sigma factor (sigma-70 family)